MVAGAVGSGSTSNQLTEEQNLAWIRSIDESEATGRLRELYDPLKTRFGVDHILTVHSLNPETVRYHHDYYAHLMRGPSNLSRIEREMIAVVVSGANECSY